MAYAYFFGRMCWFLLTLGTIDILFPVYSKIALFAHEFEKLNINYQWYPMSTKIDILKLKIWIMSQPYKDKL